jgi:hypothetical protein
VSLIIDLRIKPNAKQYTVTWANEVFKIHCVIKYWINIYVVCQYEELLRITELNFFLQSFMRTAD